MPKRRRILRLWSELNERKMKACSYLGNRLFCSKSGIEKLF
ncbi:hypothetical protein CHK_0983 [Christensenella hongkongensis]|uniref:Uncharacterized protein n=1 Tax=Christensenella hongkongensis TaxID=270498 RepID=A0A0M2NKL4_9FIRM|nr:hypothetical protein CHK_0983 [Christensenella hongkongensis]